MEFIESIIDGLGTYGIIGGGVGLAGLVGLAINKLIGKERLKAWGESLKKFFGGIGYHLGVGLTGWQNNGKLKAIWENSLEPLLISIIELVIIDSIVEFCVKFIEGLKSDNLKPKKPKKPNK